MSRVSEPDCDELVYSVSQNSDYGYHFAEIVPNKSVVGKTFKKEMKLICDKLAELSVSQVGDVQSKLKAAGSVGRYIFFPLSIL